MSTPSPNAGERVSLSLKRPSTQMLKLAAIGCFLLDVFGGAIGIGERVYLSSLGLALYVASEV